MPFTLPDLRNVPTSPAAPTPILDTYTPIPLARPSMSPEQVRARRRVEDAWHRPLTHVQRRFISALFAHGFDPTAAALEADQSIATEADARAKGRKWLKIPAIVNAIEAVHAYYTESTKVRFEDLLIELKAIAFSDISDFYDPELERVNMPAAGDPRYKSVAEISITPTRFGRAVRIKQYDKLGALEKLLKIQSPTTDPKSPAEGGVHVSIQTVNIMPVPQGMYLPAPAEDAPPPLVIEHSSAPPQARVSFDAGATVPATE